MKQNLRHDLWSDALDELSPEWITEAEPRRIARQASSGKGHIQMKHSVLQTVTGFAAAAAVIGVVGGSAVLIASIANKNQGLIPGGSQTESSAENLDGTNFLGGTGEVIPCGRYVFRDDEYWYITSQNLKTPQNSESGATPIVEGADADEIIMYISDGSRIYYPEGHSIYTIDSDGNTALFYTHPSDDIHVIFDITDLGTGWYYIGGLSLHDWNLEDLAILYHPETGNTQDITNVTFENQNYKLQSPARFQFSDGKIFAEYENPEISDYLFLELSVPQTPDNVCSVQNIFTLPKSTQNDMLHDWIVKDNQLICQKSISLQNPYSDSNGLNYYNYYALCLYDMTSGTETQISPDITDPDYKHFDACFSGDKLYTVLHDKYNNYNSIYCIDNFTNPDQIRKLIKAASTNGDDSIKPIYTAPDADISIVAVREEALFFMEDKELHWLDLQGSMPEDSQTESSAANLDGTNFLGGTGELIPCDKQLLRDDEYWYFTDRNEKMPLDSENELLPIGDEEDAKIWCYSDGSRIYYNEGTSIYTIDSASSTDLFYTHTTGQIADIYTQILDLGSGWYYIGGYGFNEVAVQGSGPDDIIEIVYHPETGKTHDISVWTLGTEEYKLIDPYLVKFSGSTLYAQCTGSDMRFLALSVPQTAEDTWSVQNVFTLRDNADMDILYDWIVKSDDLLYAEQPECH